MTKKVYGDAWVQYPIELGEVWQDKHGSKVTVHDIFGELPRFMMDADLIYCDPPWTSSLFNSFYTRAGIGRSHSFEQFTDRLFECIQEIQPKSAYIEIGRQNFDLFKYKMSCIYDNVQSWSITYYQKNPAYLIRGSNTVTDFDFGGLDDAEIPQIALQHEDFECVGDLCIGKGITAIAAYQIGKRFVGTELQKRKLALLIQNLVKKGNEFEVVNLD